MWRILITGDYLRHKVLSELSKKWLSRPDRDNREEYMSEEIGFNWAEITEIVGGDRNFAEIVMGELLDNGEVWNTAQRKKGIPYVPSFAIRPQKGFSALTTFKYYRRYGTAFFKLFNSVVFLIGLMFTVVKLYEFVSGEKLT